jgi:hypothetical protein
MSILRGNLPTIVGLIIALGWPYVTAPLVSQIERLTTLAG